MSGHSIDCACCREGRAVTDRKMEANIKKFGFTVIATEAHNRGHIVPMTYTIGLSDKGLPEIIIFGLPLDKAFPTISDAAHLLVAGELPIDKPTNLVANMDVIFKPVTAEMASDSIIQANNRAGKNLPALQMVWPDSKGKFPWQDGFEKKFACLQASLFADPRAH